MKLQPPHGCRQPIVERQAASGDTVKPPQRRACRQPTVARDPASSTLTAWRSILLMGPYTTTKPPQPAAYRQPIADIRLVASWNKHPLQPLESKQHGAVSRAGVLCKRTWIYAIVQSTWQHSRLRSHHRTQPRTWALQHVS